eukprot:Anaeramoba_ignava/a90285_3.p1 GENE.a90285_3~~a90285_3.p1  ORF type:complete len:101 (-),score=37.90 a90285_3:25-327(-)
MNKNNFDNLHFRNYSPKDENLQKYKQPIPETVKNAEKMMEKMIQQSQKKSNQFNDVDGYLLELIPKKINWDLKRDVEKIIKIIIIKILIKLRMEKKVKSE